MTNIHDVAAFITRHFDGSISTMKLQKLCYYAQGWSLALAGKPMFEEDFEAWARGPVSRDLYRGHRGQYSVSSWDGDANALSGVDVALVQAVLNNYGALSGQQLSEMTHEADTPWSRVRQQMGVDENQRSDGVIPKEEIKREFQRVFPGSSAE